MVGQYDVILYSNIKKIHKQKPVKRISIRVVEPHDQICPFLPAKTASTTAPMTARAAPLVLRAGVRPPSLVQGG